ncbi:hypothetical protein GCM10009665_28010 [Kitasatospora nipponensis]|uniref:Uncharacterized protein n=1 Tax=Kitasatospora nipponensis TaxID=258049 RepID=A0ABP4GXF8_9ACTN
MRSTLITTVRRRSSVIAASAGLATVCAASAVALAIPSTNAAAAEVAVAQAPAAAVEHRDSALKASFTDTPAAVAPIAAAGDTGRLSSAPYLKPNAPQGAGQSVTVAPYTGPQHAAPATPAAQAQQAPGAAPATAAQPQQPAPAPQAPRPPPAAGLRGWARRPAGGCLDGRGAGPAAEQLT